MFDCDFQGFNEKDVYVCESRYTSRHKAFKKIKPTVSVLLMVPYSDDITPINQLKRIS